MQQIIKSNNLIIDLEKIVNSIHHDALFILTDEHTSEKCMPIIATSEIISKGKEIVIAAGDINKNLENLSRVWQFLTENNATRHSLLLNLGGGMITDLGGFAAATFKRGIKYINTPTTLLGAVDASVGGKTGINFMGYKNEIGSFFPADFVIITPDFFQSLSSQDILSGYAEMLKHALIHSENDLEELLNFSFSNIDYNLLSELTFKSVTIKEEIVEKDPYERNIRKALNLGHTIGHALESFALEKEKPVPHGYAVAWGIIAELYLSNRVCGFSKDILLRTARFIQQAYGAFNIVCDDYETLYEFMKHDKKNEGDTINFTLISSVGEIKINCSADKDLIFEALDFYRDSVGL